MRANVLTSLYVVKRYFTDPLDTSGQLPLALSGIQRVRRQAVWCRGGAGKRTDPYKLRGSYFVAFAVRVVFRLQSVRPRRVYDARHGESL
jgi:hypothetical protein